MCRTTAVEELPLISSLRFSQLAPLRRAKQDPTVGADLHNAILLTGCVTLQLFLCLYGAQPFSAESADAQT